MRKLKVLVTSIILVMALTFGLVACVGMDASGAGGVQNDDDIATGYVVKFRTGTSQVLEDRVVRIMETEPQLNGAFNSGYNFAGWYLNSEFVGSKMVFPFDFQKYSQEHGNQTTFTMYAKWIQKSTIQISTAEELQNINNNLAGNYVLVNDIVLSDFNHYAYASEHTLDPDDYDTTEEMEKEAAALKVRYANSWVPIAGAVGKEFTGTFDGNGYTISGMSIELSAHDADPEFNYLPVGLFGKVSGTVRNVNLVDYNITVDGDVSRFYIGGLVGWVYQGSVTGSTVQGTIENLEIQYVGNMWDSLFGSYAEPTSQTYFGGAVGLIEEGNVQGVSASGKITSESNADEVYLGGAVGFIKSGSLTNSNADCYVRGRYAGGLVGYNNGAITKSFAHGDVEGSLSYPAIAGGLVAYNYIGGTINTCYATGNPKARTAGGLVGVNIFDYVTAAGGTIKNAYASGNVFASEYAGGLVGRANADLPIFGREDFHPSIYNSDDDYGSSQNRFAIIENCIAYGDVEANATETEFKDYLGNVSTSQIYYAVYAGSFIGQANEQLIKGCVAFGDVAGVSNRPPVEGYETLYNSAHVDNFIGHSTNTVVGADYRTVYAVENMLVTRNGEVFSGYETDITGYAFNSVRYQTYNMLNDRTFYTATLGFDVNIWNLTNLNVEGLQVVPTLIM